MTVFAYLRPIGSRPRQLKKSLADQRSAIGRWAAGHGNALLEFVTEKPVGRGSPFRKRTEGRLLFERLERGDVIVAATFGDLFGTPEDAHAVLTDARRIGCHFRAVDMQGGRLDLETTTPLLTALLAVSANSTYPTTVRIRAVKKREAGAGRYLGGSKPPFGFDVAPNGQLVENPAQQENIAHLLEMKQAGQTYEQLAAISERRGFKLTAPGIHKILKRAAIEPLNQN